MNLERKIEQEIKGAPVELIQPVTPEEKRLWEEIKGADKPIQNILRRLNRVLRIKFPSSSIETIDSCSGHVKEDGSIAYRAVLPEYRDRKRPKNPAIFLSAPQEKVTETEKEEIQQFLESILLQAINKTNKFFNKEAVLYENVYPRVSSSYDEDSIVNLYIFSCLTRVQMEEKAFDVLQEFWKNFEESLRVYDNIKTSEKRNKEDFYPEEPGPGLVWPE